MGRSEARSEGEEVGMPRSTISIVIAVIVIIVLIFLILRFV